MRVVGKYVIYSNNTYIGASTNHNIGTGNSWP